MDKKQLVLLVFSCIFAVCFVIKAHEMWLQLNQKIDMIITINKDMGIDGTIGDNFIKLEEDVIIQLNTINTEYDLPINFHFPDSIRLSFDGINMKSGETQYYRFHNIGENHYVNIHIENVVNNERKDYWIRTYPDFMPKFTTVGKSLLPGGGIC